MKRKAILIEASNVRGQDEIPGARKDVQNWMEFLKSDQGGAWYTTEIVPLSKPTQERVDQELNVSSDCYCFIAFSGHGCDGSVVLNDSVDTFPLSKLKPKGNQGTVIIDACRMPEESARFIVRAKQAFANEVLNRSVALNASGSTCLASARNILEEYYRCIQRTGKHRSTWDEGVKSSYNGVVQMLACSSGQGAEEDPEAGGFYTSLLLQSAKLWIAGNSTEAIHNTKHAHDYAARYLPPQQTPEYAPGAWLTFPFAVNAS